MYLCACSLWQGNCLNLARQLILSEPRPTHQTRLVSFIAISFNLKEFHPSQPENTTTTCISMALRPHVSIPSSRWYKLLSIRPLPSVSSIKMDVVATADRTYRQTLHLLSPLPTCSKLNVSVDCRIAFHSRKAWIRGGPLKALFN